MAAVFVATLVGVSMTPRLAYSQKLSSPRIVKVQSHKRVSSWSSKPAPRQNRRLKKFTTETVKEYDEVVVVHWAPPQGGLEAGAVLQLEYLQERASRTQALHIKYPFKGGSVRKAEFIIPAAALDVAGKIEAWRVRLIRDRNVVAERRSQSWRQL